VVLRYEKIPGLGKLDRMSVSAEYVSRAKAGHLSGAVFAMTRTDRCVVRPCSLPYLLDPTCLSCIL
jgi:hypothetical protein